MNQLSKCDWEEEELEGEEIRVKVKVEFGNPEKNLLIVHELKELLPIADVLPCNSSADNCNFIFNMDYWLELLETVPILDLLESFPSSYFYVIAEHEQEVRITEGKIFYVPNLKEAVNLLE